MYYPLENWSFLPFASQVDGQVVSEIGKGIMVLVGIRDGDTEHAAEQLAKKILGLKLFESLDGEGKFWKTSVVDQQGEILLVSQFTLYATIKKNNSPDFHKAMPPGQAKEFYAKFVELVRAGYVGERVKDGIFGAKMDVALVNDGPVTITVEAESQE